MKKLEIQSWTVRNQSGQYIGTWKAYTAKSAIDKAIASDNSTASTFRKSQPASLKRDSLVASVAPKMTGWEIDTITR